MGALLLAPLAAGADTPPTIHTSRASGQALPLPKPDAMFQFAVFGDRTGGPPEGVQVLAQAVKEANRLDPDLVMCVGDLVQGYNAQALWEKQMKEFRGIMEELRMPWFPVAGNHDIYWRGEGRPESEHEANYEQHFGPLWYWFEHKHCGFLVLFSDEGDLADQSKPRAFNDETQQKYSPAQLAWIKESLEKMKGLKHIFVFQHHPRWAADMYPGSNWSEVHHMLAANGNVRACFAGHIHRIRHEGIRDGIEYMTLATTGGGSLGHFPDSGYLHHFNLVTVRDSGIKVTAVPVGVVMDSRRFTPEREADLQRARAVQPELKSAPITIKDTGLGAGPYAVSLKNASRRPVEYGFKTEADDGWIITPEQASAVVEPGQEKEFAFTYVRVKPVQDAKAAPPVLLLESAYLEEGARVPLPPRRFPMIMKLGALPPAVFAPPGEETALRLNGPRSGVAIPSSYFDLPDGPFTLEGWVWVESHRPTAGLIAKAEGSEYGLLTNEGRATFIVHLNGRFVRVLAGEPLPLRRWIHVAGVYDGRSAALFLDGKLAGREPAEGTRRRNNWPLCLGADPNDKGEPGRAVEGWVDEVRLSQGARYADAFTPARRFEPDEHSILLFHLDRTAGDFVPDQGTAHAHGSLVGGAALAKAP